MSTHWLSEALLWTRISCWPLLTSAVGVAQDARCCPLGVAWNSPYRSTEHHSSIFLLQLTLGQIQYLLIGSDYRNSQYMMLRTLSHRFCDILLHQWGPLGPRPWSNSCGEWSIFYCYCLLESLVDILLCCHFFFQWSYLYIYCSR
jgi:hypothetical protein